VEAPVAAESPRLRNEPPQRADGCGRVNEYIPLAPFGTTDTPTAQLATALDSGTESTQ
jgi:hypothetical protein